MKVQFLGRGKYGDAVSRVVRYLLSSTFTLIYYGALSFMLLETIFI